MKKVLIVEDQALARSYLISCVEKCADCEVACALTCAETAPQKCDGDGIALVLMDICTERDSDGLAAAEKRDDPRAGYRLRDDRRERSALYAHAQREYEHRVEHNVEHGCRRKEEERDERIAHRAQERGVIIIKERPADAEENDEQIRPHQGPDLRRDGQERFHRIEQQEGRRIEHDGAAF